MWNRRSGFVTVALTGLVLAPLTVAVGQTAFQASGEAPVDIESAVNDFRAALGINNGVSACSPSPCTTGRREINWDGVPDAFSAPNNLPPNFFNTPVAGRARGVVFFTPGSGFQVSADSSNPANTPVEFENLRPGASKKFRTFSPERLFAALDSSLMEVLFFVPGTTIPATTRGFGAVFTDVDRDDSTKIEYFDVNGMRLAGEFVPRAKGNETLSFLGVSFTNPDVFLVRITSGGVRLGEKKQGGKDLVVMDDFIYGEPQGLVD